MRLPAREEAVLRRTSPLRFHSEDGLSACVQRFSFHVHTPCLSGCRLHIVQFVFPPAIPSPSCMQEARALMETVPSGNQQTRHSRTAVPRSATACLSEAVFRGGDGKDGGISGARHKHPEQLAQIPA